MLALFIEDMKKKGLLFVIWIAFVFSFTYLIRDQITNSLPLLIFYLISSIFIWSEKVKGREIIYLIVQGLMIASAEISNTSLSLIGVLIFAQVFSGVQGGDGQSIVLRRIVKSLILLMSFSFTSNLQSADLFHKVDLLFAILPLLTILAYAVSLQLEFVNYEKGQNRNSFFDFIHYLISALVLTKLLFLTQELAPQVLQGFITNLLSAVAVVMISIRAVQVFYVSHQIENNFWMEFQLKSSVLAVPILPLIIQTPEEVSPYLFVFFAPSLLSLFFKPAIAKIHNVKSECLNLLTILFFSFTPFSPVFWLFKKITASSFVFGSFDLIKLVIIFFAITELMKASNEIKLSKKFEAEISRPSFDLLTRTAMIGVVILFYYSRLISE